MRIQHLILGISGILLLTSIIKYDLVMAIISLIGITLSGWGFVYPEKANIWLYKVQSNYVKDKIEKELKAHTQQIKQAESHAIRFAETFGIKFSLDWSLDNKWKLIPADSNELQDDKFKELFIRFQELLQDEGVSIPDYIIKLVINRKIDDIRYEQFKDYIEAVLDKKRNASQVVKIYAEQIGHTIEEQQYMNKIFTIDYLLQYLSDNFSNNDLQLQLHLDLSQMNRAKDSILLALQEHTKDLERARRVNTIRGILYGKIKPSTPQNITDWIGQGNKVVVENLKELFVKMGYEVKEPNTQTQGINLLLKRANQKIAVKYTLISEETVSVKTIQEAFAGKNYWDCNSCIVVTNGQFSDESLETANKLQIETWDGNVLQRLMDEYWNKDIEYWNLLLYKKANLIAEIDGDKRDCLKVEEQENNIIKKVAYEV